MPQVGGEIRLLGASTAVHEKALLPHIALVVEEE